MVEAPWNPTAVSPKVVDLAGVSGISTQTYIGEIDMEIFETDSPPPPPPPDGGDGPDA